MTTDNSTVKRKRGRPKKVQPVEEKALPKKYWGYLYFMPADPSRGGERLAGQIMYVESTDILEATPNGEFPSWREFLDILNLGSYPVTDPSTGSTSDMVKSVVGGVEWFINLDKGKFEMKYGDQYIIKGIDSEYETT